MTDSVNRADGKQAGAGAARSAADLAGELLGRLQSGEAESRYRTREELARGGQGVVMRVWDQDFRRDLAMKIVLRQADTDPEAEGEEAFDPRKLARFVEEAQLTGQLDHPGIVPVHELGLDENGRLFFTMKLVKGQELGEVFERSRDGEPGWTQTRVVGVLLKVCEAMAYAHSKGVIHRDLKPSNVMVGRYGEVYVMDWGLARLLDAEDHRDLRIRPEDSTSRVTSPRRALAKESPDEPLVTMDGSVVGTPAYMSPEQATGRLDEMGPHSDVYAAGAMIYHLLAGHMPYVPRRARVNKYGIWMRVQEGPPLPIAELAPEAPAELVAICEKAMARAHGERYSDMNELAEELRAYLEHRVVHAHRTDIGTRLAKWVERNPLVTRAIGAAAIALVTLTTLFVVRLQREVRAKEAALIERNRSKLGPLLEVLADREKDLYPIAPGAVAAMREWSAAVDEALSEAEAFPEDPEIGTLAAALSNERERVRARSEHADGLARVTLEEPADAWEAARMAISESELYTASFGESLVLGPQLGLIPLGPDPHSGLWEFWLPLTGNAPPPRDPETGRLRVKEDSAAVLVLLPGSPRFTLGSDDPEQDEDRRTCLVHLDPFFVGKHEITQGQWLAVMEQNPSYLHAGTRHSDDGVNYGAFDLRHPVDYVSRDDAVEFCRRLQLVLPTEARWEYACRGGTDTKYWYGSSVDERGPYENGWQGDWGFTAPVGSLQPNRYGLHDMLGNLAEWCSDHYDHEFGPARLAGTDGARPPETEEERQARGAGYLKFNVRGGSWNGIWKTVDQTSQPPNHRHETQGFRVARSIVR